MNAEDFPKTIRELLIHPRWEGWIADELGNDLFISDPDRAARIHEAAEEGCDGSTHGEHIQDWRNFADFIFRECYRKVWDDDDKEAALDAAWDALLAEIDACEASHIAAGTIDEQGS